jgi:hypothetical protein
VSDEMEFLTDADVDERQFGVLNSFSVVVVVFLVRTKPRRNTRGNTIKFNTQRGYVTIRRRKMIGE